jgi:dihydroorotase
MLGIVIKGGRVIDPANNIDKIADLYVSGGEISALRVPRQPDTMEGNNSKPDNSQEADTIIDATGYWVVPGFIDLHTHLRDPGFEYKETIATGSLSAVKGGFTTICCMPNTNPVVDNPEIVKYIREKAKDAGYARILPVASVTQGMRGQILTDMEALVRAGACAFSEDGKSVANPTLMKRALVETSRLGVPIFDHCEDAAIAGKGVINQGESSKRLNLIGISGDAEDIMTARDILLAQSVKAKLHICHVSTRRAAELIKFFAEREPLERKNAAAGVESRGMFRVFAEVCPHHFALCDEDIQANDGNFKMNPPLRSRSDMMYLRSALAQNIIEVIATDHAPHSIEEKSGGFEKSAFGVVGLETAFAISLSVLKELSPSQIISKLTCNPARVLGINAGTLSVGSNADITIIDPKAEWVIDPRKFVSKGRNTPFAALRVKGVVKYTIVEGRLIFRDLYAMKV